MARKKRRKFTPEFKAKVALEALKERSTLAELAQKYDLLPVQISKWKRELKDNISTVFENPKTNDLKKQEDDENRLYAEIGRLKMELDWLKKKNGVHRLSKSIH